VGQTSKEQLDFRAKFKNPTPDERAELVVKRLEMFIRENRTEHGGMSFKKWQDLAQAEIVAALLEDEADWRRDDSFMTKLYAATAAALVTIGMWGTVMAFLNSKNHTIEGVMLFGGGMALLAIATSFGTWQAFKRFKKNRRDERLKRVRSMDAKLKQLDRDLEKRVKDMEGAVEELARQKTKRMATTKLREEAINQMRGLRAKLEAG